MAVKPLLIYNYVDYDIKLSNYIIELLTHEEPIKTDTEYINDYYGDDRATGKRVSLFADCPVFIDLKTDMESFATEICNAISERPEVKSATVNDSPNHAGISTYITVLFKHPKEFDSAFVQDKLKTDPQYITHYESGIGNGEGLGGEYKLEFRLSTHDVSRRKGTSADVYIDITGKVFDYFKRRVLSYVDDRIRYINDAWQNYKEKGEYPQEQIERNRIRSRAKHSRRPWIQEMFISKLNNYKLTESTASNIIEVNKYLQSINLSMDDLLIWVDFMFSDIPVEKLIDVMAICLSENIIEYTYEDRFDYELFYNDLVEILYN